MKIMFLIPVNTDFTQRKEDISAYLESYISPDMQIEFVQVSQGFLSVESELQGMVNGCHVVKAYLNRWDQFDGVYVNCFDDPGVYPCREIGYLPVIGPYQAAVSTASAIAERIGIITTDVAGILSEERKARKEGVAEKIVSIRPVNLPVSDIRSEQEVLTETLFQLCKEMVEKDRVSAICLGCTAMFYVADKLRDKLQQERVQVNIIEPIANGINVLQTLIRQNLTNAVPIEIDFDTSIL